MRLDPNALLATDTDSEDELISFTIHDKSRSQGVIVKRQTEAPKNLTGWSRRNNGQYERIVTKWLQGDINGGRMYYRHTAGQVCEAFSYVCII